MVDDWDTIGEVMASKYRTRVLEALRDSPKTPSSIADEMDIGIAHVSRALKGLQEYECVELLVPEDRKKGRIYALTEHGREIANQIEQHELTE